MKDLLFQPIKLNTLELKNRICMPAMHLNMCNNFEVTDQLIDFYAERARGGAGLITVGFATVDELSGGPLFIGAHQDAFIPGLRRLATAIKENGSAAAVQINHPGRYAFSHLIKKQPIAPSAVASRYTRETPRELPIEEISQVVHRFAQAARRVKEAGFDCVEVLSSTGYLISQFLSPVSNKRTDAYGGSLGNRMRFGLEVLAAVRSAVGPDYPILVRMNGNDFMPGGNGREELQAYAKALSDAGVDALNVNVGWHEARVPQITTAVPRGIYGYLSRGIKERVDVPVIAGHRINDPETAREMLTDGLCDMVAMGRPLIADPDLPEKARSGQEDMIVHCVGCAQGCFDHLFKEIHVECLCNPKAGHEKECRLTETGSPLKVMVVGGGAAGMSAALAAAECGHTVTLYEKANQLGGQLFLAAAPPGREEFAEFARDLANQVLNSRVQVVLNQTVDEALVDQAAPDAVILSTGAVPLTLPIPGVDLAHVVQAWDVLLNRVTTGKRVVVIGGGAVGLETALFLAEKGTLSGEAVKFLLVNRAEDPETLFELASKGSKEIVMIEMIPKIGKDVGMTTRWTMLQDLARQGVTVQVNTKALEITETGVKVERDGAPDFIAADTVVLAAGARPYNPLSDLLEKKGIACQVVGDAGRIGLAFDAVHQGFAAGKNVGAI
ncbi:MAG: FAD-dependent oxidoreductase [Deltaproteobacteria bacterium]|nr:FAD-dependent oxidoreductase [Deltaproteobacteria bacterium]